MAKPEHSQISKNYTSCFARTEAALEPFLHALERETKLSTRLSLWSRFIRARDDYQCVVCGSIDRLAAHHIARKSFIWYAQLDTGNGITLCHSCHKDPHRGFNRRPDMSQPMDAQGGEKIEMMWFLYQHLLRDAIERSMLYEEFYFINPRVIQSFKLLQGLDPNQDFPGGSLEQVCLIWRQTPRHMFNALMSANGFRASVDFIQNGPMNIF